MSVELRKGQKVSLKKCNASIGEILINLNWSQPASGGFYARAPQPKGGLFELKDGAKGAVQALENNFGSLT